MKNDADTPKEDELLREPQVLALLTISRSTFRRLIATGQFPAGIKITARIRVWRRSSVLEWLNQGLRNPSEGEKRL